MPQRPGMHQRTSCLCQLQIPEPAIHITQTHHMQKGECSVQQHRVVPGEMLNGKDNHVIFRTLKVISLRGWSGSAAKGNPQREKTTIDTHQKGWIRQTPSLRNQNSVSPQTCIRNLEQ